MRGNNEKGWVVYDTVNKTSVMEISSTEPAVENKLNDDYVKYNDLLYGYFMDNPTAIKKIVEILLNE